MIIKLDNICKTYSARPIFNGVNVEYQSGNIYGISGNNGSGKSTLLKIIAGFITPNQGKITYQSHEKEILVEDIFEHVSYAAPYIDLPLDMNFDELLDFHFTHKSRLNKISNSDIISIVHLPKDKSIRLFSSGMIQRVKLALAFFSETKILLLDEPTEMLDTQGTELYHHLLTTYSQSRIVIVSSNKDPDFSQCISILSIGDYIK